MAYVAGALALMGFSGKFWRIFGHSYSIHKFFTQKKPERKASDTIEIDSLSFKGTYTK
jgi:hypothetical protein